MCNVYCVLCNVYCSKKKIQNVLFIGFYNLVKVFFNWQNVTKVCPYWLEVWSEGSFTNKNSRLTFFYKKYLLWNWWLKIGFLSSDFCLRYPKSLGLASKMSEKLPRVVFRLKEQHSETLAASRSGPYLTFYGFYRLCV